MGSKGLATRERIMETAKELFAKNGFCAVTMQDICRSAGLSRGGLYRHFSSTEEIFSAIIEQEQQRAMEALERARSLHVSPKRMTVTFLRYRLQALLNERSGIDAATSEFCANSEQGRALLRRRAETGIRILSGMIRDGIAAGEFSCPDPDSTAMHILCLLEGLGKHNGLMPIDAATAERQLDQLMQLLGCA